MSSYGQPPVLVLGELSLVHCIGTAGIPVITASEKKQTSTAYSKYSSEHVVFSSYESEEFINELCELGKKNGQKLVFVTYDDRVILNISKHRQRLEEHYLFLLPDHERVEQLLDKLRFCELCEERNLPAPQTLRVTSDRDLTPQKIKTLQAPYLIKPAYRHYWFHEDFTEVVGNYQKAYKCSTFPELQRLYTKIRQINPDVVVQEYIVGDDSCMFDVNFYINQQGEIECYVMAQKIRVYPPDAGWGSYVKTIHNLEIFNACLQLIEKLNLRGLINIQFKQDSRSGEFKLIEIHTRTSIFDFLGAKAGQNIPALYYASLTGRQVPISKESDYRNGVKYINIGRDLRLFLRYRHSYNVSLGRWLKTYLEASVFDGLLLSDLYPALRKLI